MFRSKSKKQVVLLGPQRRDPNLAQVVDDLGLARDAKIAAVTAGWEEREPEDLELGEHLGGRVVNLRVFQRGDDIYQRDPELHQAMRDRHDTQRELQELYRMRLSPALDSARQLMHHEGDPRLLDPMRQAAIDTVRDIDRQHFAQVEQIHVEFEQRWNPSAREVVAGHRAEIEKTLRDCAAVCFAGGHVGILLNRVRLLGLTDLLGDRSIIGWSGGAMVLTERIVLFHDSPPQGPGDAEVFGPALGICSGIVPLPHARKRLRLDDPTRVGILARRFSPDLCAALDGGCSARWDGKRWHTGGSTQQLLETGQLAGAGAS